MHIVLQICKLLIIYALITIVLLMWLSYEWMYSGSWPAIDFFLE